MDELHFPSSGRTDADTGPDAEVLSDELNRLWTFSRAFSNTAHELNNGLQIIAGQAEMVAMSCTAPEAQRRLTEILATVARSAAQLETLLSYGRLVPAEPRSLDVAGMIRACVEMRTASLARRRIFLRPPVLPSPCLAVVDRARFMHLLLDLLLACEDEAVRGRAGSMAVDVDQRPAGLVVRVQAHWEEGDPTPAEEAPADPGGGPLSLAVARRLAAYLGGRLSEQRGERRLDLELEVPSPRG